MFLLSYSVVFWLVKKNFKISLYIMLRLTLLGIAIASFMYAFLDVFWFYNFNLNAGAFLSSIALGGLLTVFERIVDLYEKKVL